MIIHDVEQNTPEWETLRAGMPTASNFSKLITSTGEPSKSMPGYANLLAAEKYAERPLNDFEGNYWTERGHELEEQAASMYELLYDVTADKVGFVTNDEATYGCSPDRLIGDEGMLEIKCLKVENHIEAILYYKKHGKVPPKYVQQVQGQMMICERKWCHSVFYCPSLPLLVIDQKPDAKVVNGLKKQLEQVIKTRDEIAKVLEEM